MDYQRDICNYLSSSISNESCFHLKENPFDYYWYSSISNESCSDYLNIACMYNYDKILESMANAPMPWIGLYVAAASLICTIAMAADLFIGFRNKKLWLPCKFFTLNAASLTLLAVAMKLPMDLSTSMPDYSDQLAKIGSSIFICMVMGNFMPSLGQMNNNEIIMNIVALDILIVTIFVNLCIQVNIGIQVELKYAGTLILPLMFFLFVIMNSSALYVTSTRKYINLRYREIHEASSTEESDIIRNFNVEKLKEDVTKYWMMAQTSSPQFVIARSVTCVASGVTCLLTASFLLIIVILINGPSGYYLYKSQNASSYKWSTRVILVIQTIGVVVGAITCAVRLFTTIILKCSGLRVESLKTGFKTENYWIERLVEWKEKPLPLNIRSQMSKRLVHNLKNLFLCFCIRVQIVVVVVSKTIQIFFVLVIAPFMFWWFCWKSCKWLRRKFIHKSAASNNHLGSETTSGRKMDLSHYILRLENENELPKRMVKNIISAVDHLIQMGQKKQPENLKEILKKSSGFNGVAEFDSVETPSLDFNEPPNSWMMTVVTLTSIAIALPNIANQMVEELSRGVNEGLVYIRLVEKDLDGKGYLVNIRNAAEVTWSRVELSRKWLDQDLRKMASKEKNSKGTLESLADIAKKTIAEFKGRANEIQKGNPLEWPIKAIAANSAYRITQTLLIDYELGNQKTDVELFEKLSIMISDILAACLTNLPRVITMKCFCSVAEKREESVQQAAQLLGETEEILKILQERELPRLNQAQASYIDEWREIIKQDHNPPSPSNSETACDDSDEIHIVVK